MRRPPAAASAAVLLVVFFAALYAAAGYWLAPRYLEPFLAQKARELGFELRLDALRTDPFRLAVELRGAQLRRADGSLSVTAERASADLAWSSLWSKVWTLQEVAVQQAAVRYADRARGELRIDSVNARLTDLTTAGGGSGRYALSGKVGGGTISSAGTLSLSALAAHGTLELAGVAAGALPRPLPPQIEVGAGTISAQGKLRVDGAQKPRAPRVAYRGSISLRDFALIEKPAGAPLFSLARLDTPEVNLSVLPNRLEAREVFLREPSGRLIIGADGKVNFARVLGDAQHDAGGEKSAQKTAAVPGQDVAFPVVVRRLHVRGGSLEFADLSLSPRFATEIHDLTGVVSGLSTEPGSAARLELDGRVERYGSARVRGVIEPFSPKSLTALALTFRNLEMKSFTPYSAKFAGYRIESGKLSADLRYRLRDGRLLGDNRLIVDKLRLGERVESAAAPDLPIELALALLTDADGRIELGLPVSGDLSDPHFSFPDLLAKVFRNIVGKVAAAPFRLLDSLLGRDTDDDLGRILFPAGSARLTPPEEEKAAAVAKAIAERPQLELAIRGGYDAAADAAALREQTLRRELARRSGLRVGSTEDPGPLDLAAPRTRRALEALFIEHGGTAMRMKELRAEAARNADAQRAREAGAERAAERRYARALFDRVAVAMPVPDRIHEQLAQARGEVVRAALLVRGADPKRVRVDGPQSAPAEADGVPTLLALNAR